MMTPVLPLWPGARTPTCSNTSRPSLPGHVLCPPETCGSDRIQYERVVLRLMKVTTPGSLIVRFCGRRPQSVMMIVLSSSGPSGHPSLISSMTPTRRVDDEDPAATEIALGVTPAPVGATGLVPGALLHATTPVDASRMNRYLRYLVSSITPSFGGECSNRFAAPRGHVAICERLQMYRAAASLDEGLEEPRRTSKNLEETLTLTSPGRVRRTRHELEETVNFSNVLNAGPR